VAARSRLRTLRDVPDETAYKAVAWLPLRYFVWGLVFGYLVLLCDFLFQWRGDLFEPWTSPANIAGNIGQFLGAMLFMGAITAIVGFISRAALRKRLGGLYGHVEAGRR
jgi:hypothetical protein